MFAFTVARRYLLSNPLQTALLVAGVALGVTIFVFITALIQGLAITLTDRVTANSAHVSLQPDTRRARVLGAPGVVSAGQQAPHSGPVRRAEGEKVARAARAHARAP